VISPTSCHHFSVSTFLFGFPILILISHYKRVYLHFPAHINFANVYRCFMHYCNIVQTHFERAYVQRDGWILRLYWILEAYHSIIKPYKTLSKRNNYDLPWWEEVMLDYFSDFCNKKKRPVWPGVFIFRSIRIQSWEFNSGFEGKKDYISEYQQWILYCNNLRWY